MAIDANVWKRKIVNIYLFLLLSLPWLVSLEQFVASHSLPLALLSEPPSTTPARLEVLSAAHIGTTSSSPRHWLNDKKKNRNILHSVLGKQQQKPPLPSLPPQCHVPLTWGVCPASGQGTDRRTGCGARAGIPSQFIDPGNVQRNTPTGTWSAWKRAREDPARLEWVQTAAQCQQNHHPPKQSCQPADSCLPGVGRSCQPRLVVGWRVCSPLLNEPCIPPVPLPLPLGASPKANQPSSHV